MLSQLTSGDGNTVSPQQIEAMKPLIFQMCPNNIKPIFLRLERSKAELRGVAALQRSVFSIAKNSSYSFVIVLIEATPMK